MMRHKKLATLILFFAIVAAATLVGYFAYSRQTNSSKSSGSTAINDCSVELVNETSLNHQFTLNKTQLCQLLNNWRMFEPNQYAQIELERNTAQAATLKHLTIYLTDKPNNHTFHRVTSNDQQLFGAKPVPIPHGAGISIYASDFIYSREPQEIGPLISGYLVKILYQLAQPNRALDPDTANTRMDTLEETQHNADSPIITLN